MTGETAPLPAASPRRALFALGLSQLRARPSVVLGVVFFALVIAGVAAVGGALAWRGRDVAARVPSLAAEIFAWGPGMLVAFGGALHAFRNDATEGVLALVASRGVPLRAYVTYRALALAALLTVLGAVGVVTVTVTIAMAAPDGALAGSAVAAGVGALVHAIAFAFTMAPVVLAALGGLSRGAGYLALVSVLVGPEIARLFLHDVPGEWRPLLSIPSCLSALGDATTPGHADLVRTVGAFLVVAAVASVATAIAGRVAERAAAPKPDPRPFDRALRGETHNA